MNDKAVDNEMLLVCYSLGCLRVRRLEYKTTLLSHDVAEVAEEAGLTKRCTRNALARAMRAGFVRAITLRCISQGHGYKSKYNKRFYHLTVDGRVLVSKE